MCPSFNIVAFCVIRIQIVTDDVDNKKEEEVGEEVIRSLIHKGNRIKDPQTDLHSFQATISIRVKPIKQHFSQVYHFPIGKLAFHKISILVGIQVGRQSKTREISQNLCNFMVVLHGD